MGTQPIIAKSANKRLTERPIIRRLTTHAGADHSCDEICGVNTVIGDTGERTRGSVKMAPDKPSQKDKENKTVPPAKANKTVEAENLEMLRDLAAQLEGQGESNKAPSNAAKTQRIPKKTGRTATVTSTGHRSPLSRIDEQNEWEDDFAYDPAMTAMTMGMGFLPYPPQFFPPPHAGFGAPMTMADPDEPEEGDTEIETEDDLGSPEPVDQDGEGSPEGDLLSVVRECYVDEDGPPVETELAKF